MIEVEMLKKVGLSEKESRVYLSCLELGVASVVEISKKARIKRPTAYLVLEGLRDRGLVSELPKEKGVMYSAEDPRVIQSDLKNKLREYHEFLPFLNARYNKKNSPKIRFFEGKDAVSKVYVNEIFPSKTIYFYGTSAGSFISKMPELYKVWEDYWWPKKKKSGETVKEIVGNTAEDIDYAQQVKSERNIRVLPRGMSFHADNAVTEDKVFIVSVENMFSVVIESEDLAATHRTLAELAWRASDVP